MLRSWALAAQLTGAYLRSISSVATVAFPPVLRSTFTTLPISTPDTRTSDCVASCEASGNAIRNW